MEGGGLGAPTVPPSKTDWGMGEGGYLIGEFYLNE